MRTLISTSMLTRKPLFSSMPSPTTPVAQQIPLESQLLISGEQYYPSVLNTATSSFFVAFFSVFFLLQSQLPGKHYQEKFINRRLAVRFLAMLSALYLFVQERQLRKFSIVKFSNITGGEYRSIDGVNIHYLDSASIDGKSYSTTTTTVYHCIHGFGSNCLSFQPCINAFQGSQRLSQTNIKKNVRFIAHDTPGFGLNVRSTIPTSNSVFYRPMWNARATLALAAEHATPSAVEQQRNPQDEQHRTDCVFMGHSMGAATAIIAAASTIYASISSTSSSTTSSTTSPTRLILIAPAISGANINTNKSMLNTKMSREEAAAIVRSVHEKMTTLDLTTQTRTNINTNTTINTNIISRISNFFFSTFTALLQTMTKFILRRITRSVRFWKICLAFAWATKKVSTAAQLELVRGYMLPSLARGFDSSLLRFVSAQRMSSSDRISGSSSNSNSSSSISNSSSSSSSSSSDGKGVSWSSVSMRKEEVGNRGYPFPSSQVTHNITQLQLLKALLVLGVDVYIVHGAKDPIIPLQNSLLLSSLLGGGDGDGDGDGDVKKVCVQVMQQCGHCPHEEDADTFLKLCGVK